jgi:hypothetical protein
MKTKAAVQIVISSLSITFAMLLFAPSSFGQGGGTVYQSQLGPVQEEYHGQDYVPEIGQKGSLNPESTPYRHDIDENDSTDLGKPMHDQDTTTVYEKDGDTKKDEASVFKGEHRGRITHGKRTEHFVVTDSKPAKIKQTKDGSSDATESTGVFKDSLLDIASSDSLSLVAETKTAAQPRPSAAPRALPSASPKSSPKPETSDSSQFELSLGMDDSTTIGASTPAPSPSR